MKYINPWLVDGYCSITVANYELIRLIRFVSRISTQLSKNFINKFYLILQNSKILFDDRNLKKSLKINSTEDLDTLFDKMLFIAPKKLLFVADWR